ncbi:MAG TPA: Holliday junction branch migration protein RuvA [Candidatus Limnocylindria bacterium]|nr:Holliday junction branch migration protein RuvA [Candidatus Limnocylindria bacterium]
MIAYIKGKILEKTLSYIVVENNGLGYKVFTTPDVLTKSIYEEVALWTYHKVADDGQALFGLPTFSDLQFFELLISVSGVGPKMALAILSSGQAQSIKQAIANQDAAIFTRISGIGSKTAERIIVDLKNKVGAADSSGSASSEIFDALLALGYNQREVREVINKLDHTKPQDQQLKQALQMFGKK